MHALYPAETEEFTTSATGEGLFVVNQGNFMYANASLSYYNPQTKDIENEIFVRANGINLGDVAQSMVLYKETAYVVVNNSGVVFAIDPKTFTLKGMLTGLVSPGTSTLSTKTKPILPICMQSPLL